VRRHKPGAKAAAKSTVAHPPAKSAKRAELNTGAQNQPKAKSKVGTAAAVGDKPTR
jgi:hypothetical protein